MDIRVVKGRTGYEYKYICPPGLQPGGQTTCSFFNGLN